MDFSAMAYKVYAAPDLARTGLVPASGATQTRMPMLAGSVTDTDGEPLRGVHVRVLRGDKVVGWNETNCNGQYEVLVPVGTYTVEFCSKAYRPLSDAVAVCGPCTNLDAALDPVLW